MPETSVDIRLTVDQHALPDDLTDDDLQLLRAALSPEGTTGEVVVEPSGQPRDLITTPVVLLLHFLTAHGADIALSVAEAALWDGLKGLIGRIRRRQPDRAVRVRVTYPDGHTIEVEANDPEALLPALRAARAVT